MKEKKFGLLKKFGLFISGVVGASIFPLTPASAVILIEPIVNTRNPLFPDTGEIPPGLPPNQVIPWVVPDSTGQQNFLNSTEFAINRISIILLNALTPDLDLDGDGFHDLDINKDGFPDQVAWGDVNGDGQIGESNIFSTITIDPNFVTQPVPELFVPAPRLDLTQGIISRGELFTFQFITSENLTPSEPGDNGPLLVGGVFDGTPVPEPSTFFGVFGYALVLGLNYWRRKHQ